MPVASSTNLEMIKYVKRFVEIYSCLLCFVEHEGIALPSKRICMPQNSLSWNYCDVVLANTATDAVEYVTTSGKIGSLPNLPVQMSVHGAIARNDDVLVVARR